MAYIKKEFIEVAKGRDRYLALQLQTLSKHAVVGVMNKADLDALQVFLIQLGIPFNSNGKSLVWLEVLSTKLKKLFIKQK